jgi:Uma2 family endonuclease
MSTMQIVDEHRVLFEQVSWEAYEALLKSWEERNVRLTYDRGMLEILSPFLGHERPAAIIRQMVHIFTLELSIPLRSGGSTTLRSAAKRRGLDPDKCFWIQNEGRMRLRRDFDLERDPPPDLAIEVDITSSSLDRMSIYADLGVPEVWRFDGETFSIQLLAEGKAFEASDRSPALPLLPPDVVQRFLERSDAMDDTELMVEFLEWIRKEVKKKKKPARKTRRPRKK